MTPPDKTPDPKIAGRLSQFERLVAEGRKAVLADELEPAAKLLREGLEIWRQPGLAELQRLFPAEAALARLDELRLAAHEDLILVELALGQHDALIPELESLIRHEPYRESLRAHLMVALYRSGRQEDALAAYRQARRALAEEFGAEPSGELRRLEQSIKAEDPALAFDPGAPLGQHGVPAPRERAALKEGRN